MGRARTSSSRRSSARSPPCARASRSGTCGAGSTRSSATRRRVRMRQYAFRSTARPPVARRSRTSSSNARPRSARWRRWPVCRAASGRRSSGPRSTAAHGPRSRARWGCRRARCASSSIAPGPAPNRRHRGHSVAGGAVVRRRALRLRERARRWWRAPALGAASSGGVALKLGALLASGTIATGAAVVDIHGGQPAPPDDRARGCVAPRALARRGRAGAPRSGAGLPGWVDGRRRLAAGTVAAVIGGLRTVRGTLRRPASSGADGERSPRRFAGSRAVRRGGSSGLG